MAMNRVISYRVLVIICILLLLVVLRYNSNEKNVDKYIVIRKGETDEGKQTREALTDGSDKADSWWLERQRNRREHLSSACQNMKNFKSLSELVKDKDLLNYLLVDDKRKTLFCYIPKVACSNWKRMFLILTGRSKVEHPDDIPYLTPHITSIPTLSDDNFSPNGIRRRLETYKKFLFVRDPMERLVSAYRNKLEGSTPRFKSVADRILKNYRTNDEKKSSNVTFAQFIRLIINTPQIYYLSDHWKPFYELCFPCAIQYDFIGKYGTLHEDADHILEQMGVPKDELQFPPFKASSSKSLMTTYTDTLTQSEHERLMKIFAPDYKLFGYKIPNFGKSTDKR